MSRLAQAFCRSAPWRAFAGRVVLPWALHGVELHGDVLEIGCGSGAMAAEMAQRFPGIRLTATDYDESMVAVATLRLAERADVRQADATSLPFADATFDRVVTFVMLHHVMAWEQALAEIARVLRPGGILVGYDLLADGIGGRINGREEGTRVMRAAELRDELARLPFTTVSVHPSVTRLVARFHATRLVD
jgi:ubiquinone/menaquinone biosynthesis C-methylase UbiE